MRLNQISASRIDTAMMSGALGVPRTFPDLLENRGRLDTAVGAGQEVVWDERVWLRMI